jgi:hypothetical protein
MRLGSRFFVFILLTCAAAAQQPVASPSAHLERSQPLETDAKPAQPASEIHQLPDLPQSPKFSWGPAIRESLMFLGIQHSVLSITDRGYISARGGLFNNYWRDYKLSLKTWANTGWDDGDPFLDNYIAHPIQGSLTGYIQVQNDPRGRGTRFGKNSEYWKSRLKATAWSAAYSTQFEIGPLSEMTVQKYGTFGSWPQDGKMINGTGQVDLVMTPTLGLAWMLGEDVLDEKVIRKVENKSGNRFWINFLRSALNPTRAGANVLHGKAPWHRWNRRPLVPAD